MKEWATATMTGSSRSSAKSLTGRCAASWMYSTGRPDYDGRLTAALGQMGRVVDAQTVMRAGAMAMAPGWRVTPTHGIAHPGLAVQGRLDCVT